MGYRIFLSLLSLTGTPCLMGQVEYTTAGSLAVVHYEAEPGAACRVEASEWPGMQPLLPATNPLVVAGGNSDERFAGMRKGRQRTFLLGMDEVAVVGDEVIPLSLAAERTYYVRIRCQGQEPLTGVIQSGRRPKGLSGSGEAATSTACNVTMDSTESSYPASMGESSTSAFSINAATNCSWTATVTGTWIRLLSGDSGTGPGTVTFVIETNEGGARSGQVSVNGRAFTVQQMASPCAPVLSYSHSWFPASGGTYSVEASMGAQCSWVSASPVSWIEITSAESGTGSDVVHYTIEANTGSGRYADVIAGSAVLHVNQAAGSPALCAITFAPASSWAPTEGGVFTLHVPAPPGCTWTVTAVPAWVHITSISGGDGPGTIGYSVDANTGGVRNGQIIVSGGQVSGAQYTLNQVALTCGPQSTAAIGSAGAAGGIYAVTFTTPALCVWSVSSSMPWVQVVAPLAGIGSAAVSVGVASNSAFPRSATLTFLFQNGERMNLEVNQASPPTVPCPVVLPSGAWYPAAAGSYALPVAANPSCPWTATSTVPWVHFTGLVSGAGKGSVLYKVDANTGAVRTGLITINTVPYLLKQVAAGR